MSPTQRALNVLRADGWTAEVVERWNPHSRTRKDLFGFIDIVAIRKGECLGVQATSASNHAARVKKAKGIPALQTWLSSGCSFCVLSFRKPAGSRKYLGRMEFISLPSSQSWGIDECKN